MYTLTQQMAVRLGLVFILAVGSFAVTNHFMDRSGFSHAAGAPNGVLTTKDPPANTKVPAVAPANLPPATTPVSTAPPQQADKVMVHVAGRVAHPAVYTMPASARVQDAIKAAGGALPDADLDAINLAAHLEDAEQIYLPAKGEITIGTTSKQPSPAGGASASGKNSTRATGSSSKAGKGSPNSKKLTNPSQGMVNINTAPASDLLKLPGVGPATAQRIIDFRKANGPFHSIDDIKSVKGIGPAKFAKMKPFIKV